MPDSPPDRFSRTADRLAAKQDARADELAEKVRRFVLPRGDERAVDVGTGAGALAFALAAIVREVVGVDPSRELLAQARERARGVPNVEFVEADGEHLPFDDYSFDLAATIRTLHHVQRPERLIAELVRVTRMGGRLLVVDQIAPADPLSALAIDRFERTRDPGHTRLLPESDLRQLFEANGLVLLRDRREVERRPLDDYLDLAGCDGGARERAIALAPEGPSAYTATLGWYLLETRG